METGGYVCVGIGVLLVAAVIGGTVLRASIRRKRENARRDFIYSKYGKSQLAEDIIARRFWTGQTAEQLRDSLGPAVDVDQKVLKTKVKEVWKYAQRGTNRFALRITLDDGIVVGWDEKL
jgi:hypothetical protein